MKITAATSTGVYFEVPFFEEYQSFPKFQGLFCTPVSPLAPVGSYGTFAIIGRVRTTKKNVLRPILLWPNLLSALQKSQYEGTTLCLCRCCCRSRRPDPSPNGMRQNPPRHVLKGLSSFFRSTNTFSFENPCEALDYLSGDKGEK